ncbi:tetratricopeptide repeat protein [Polynucleobacter wuianus]|uniref:tetratricopeptide repeat protein n=1 Tax=Polynucleobacter wuianus TaxID=1743168 RepID=UPI001C0C2829|nr:tetratricopeptide repeat protein [Polynucleobacter wuianus]MBU3610047.1 tetratricopeptide repeat protein [Polynucleobacter wuianus]
MNPLLRQAVLEQQRTNFTQAFNLYAQFLEQNPNDPKGLFLFGLFEAQRGNLLKGLELLTKSIHENPHNTDAHYNQAVIYLRLSQFTEAKKSLEKAIQLNPLLAEAHFNLGVVFMLEKNSKLALDHLSRTIKIKPHFLDALIRRGLIHLENQQFDLALQDFKAVLAINPQHLDALLNSGVAFQKSGRLNEALERYQLTLQLKPDWADALLNTGVTLSKLKRFEEALVCYEKAFSLIPDAPDLWSNKGITLSKLRKFDQATACFDKAIEINPNYAEAWLNKGNNFHSASQFPEAIQCFDKAIEINPNYAEAWSNKGVSLSFLKQFDEAIDCYNKAINLDKTYVDSRWNLAISQLTTGKFSEGWNNYEYRWDISNPIPKQFTHIPRLNSLEQLGGRNILVWFEQGLGDTIQFCRYVTLLKKYAASISLVVQPSLVEVLGDLRNYCQIYSHEDLPSEKFDFQCPLLSLPRLFVNTAVATPYLKADPIKSAIWKSRLANGDNRLKVGLVWNGGFRADQPEVWSINERRNIPFEIFANLRLVPGVDFFSLQKGEPAESELLFQKNQFWPNANFCNYVSELHNFSDTAALIDNLDLVISVDTSTAHLAGAMGKPVWILNRFDACWRWQVNRKDSPWYPTAKLFHQKQHGDWAQVIDEVRLELTSTINNTTFTKIV